MAGVSVVFKAVDDISSRFDTMTAASTKALDTFDRMEAAADSSYGAISEGAAEALHCERPWKAIGEVAASVAIDGPGLKGSCSVLEMPVP